MSAHGKVDYDKTETNSKAMLIFLLSLVVFLVLIGIGVLYMTKVVRDNVYIEKVSELDRPYEVEQLRAYENDMLSTYGVIDQNKGVYRIPIDKAMEKVISQYK